MCENLIYTMNWNEVESWKDTLAREYVCNSNTYDYIIIEIMEYWAKYKISRIGHLNHERETLNY